MGNSCFLYICLIHLSIVVMHLPFTNIKISSLKLVNHCFPSSSNYCFFLYRKFYIQFQNGIYLIFCWVHNCWGKRYCMSCGINSIALWVLYLISMNNLLIYNESNSLLEFGLKTFPYHLKIQPIAFVMTK